MLEDAKKKLIFDGAKKWFREVIVPNHIENTKKLVKANAFKINPFLVKYLARYLSGNADPVSIAKVLIYPRVLATSITTSFGTNAQKFTTDALGSFGSLVPGIDIEFTDQIDGGKKYCQIKLGPSTINKDDVETIHQHFRAIKNKAKTDNLKLAYNSLVIGILYGEKAQISANYKNLEKKHDYTVYVGKEFWTRLTGSELFYDDLSTAIGEVALECDGTKLLEETILNLSESSVIKNLADA